MVQQGDSKITRGRRNTDDVAAFRVPLDVLYRVRAWVEAR
jgi:hypothetical protein